MKPQIFSDGYGDFPPYASADEHGLLAIGGTLAADRLLYAYENGIFPWYNEGDPICWYCPPVRCVLFPGKVYLSRSMLQVLRSGKFRITENQCFDRVIHACASRERKGQDGTWINDDMITAYTGLHRSGHAKSIEVWEENELVGGLYGVEAGNIFCGESMFSDVPNASKAALIYLCRNKNYTLIDCQVTTAHLLRMGAEEIEREIFLQLLRSEKKEEE